MLLILYFVAYPLGTVVYYGFTRWDGLSPPEFVGFHNYRVLADDPVFRLALRNNFLFALSVPIQMTLPLVLAYLIHVRITGWSFFRATFFIPATIATVVVGIVAYSTFQVTGALNSLLGAVGLDALQHDWLARAHTSIPLILFVVVWANFGYNVLIYLAGHVGARSRLGGGRPDGRRRSLADADLGRLAQPTAGDGAGLGDLDRDRLCLHVHLHLRDHQRRAWL